jgi:hypothetical protein
LLWTNLQGNRGDPLRPGNKNILVHTAAEDWPYQVSRCGPPRPRPRAVVRRGDDPGTYASARLLFGDERPALVAAAINALLPQFVFMGALLSNDVAGAALAAAGLYLLRDSSRRRATGAWRRRSGSCSAWRRSSSWAACCRSSSRWARWRLSRGAIACSG